MMLKKLRTISWKSVLLGLLLFSAGASADSFSVVSFNTWGVPFAVYDKWRYAEAMKRISAMSPDFVLLQEVFSPRGRKDFQNKKLYPYRVDGPAAFPRLISSGLRILSKHPILRKATLAYRACRKDDCFARKGALLAVVQLPSGEKLNIVTTHLNARGEDSVREDQLYQLQLFLTQYLEPGAPLLLNGDMNFNPESPLYPALLSTFGVRDAWIDTHGITDPGYTSDSQLNYYAHDYSVKHHFPLTRERIDLLLTQNLKTEETRIIFNDALPLSDHFGLWSRYSELPKSLDLNFGMSNPVHDPEVVVVQ